MTPERRRKLGRAGWYAFWASIATYLIGNPYLIGTGTLLVVSMCVVGALFVTGLVLILVFWVTWTG